MAPPGSCLVVPSPLFTPSDHDAGARLSCRETVTYPPPLGVTVAATSRPRKVGGAPAPAPAPATSFLDRLVA